MRSRRRAVATLGAMVLLGSLALVVVPGSVAGAVTVDPNIPDGDPGSLRDVLDNAVDGDVIDLVAGATYVLDQTNSDDGLSWSAAVTINGHGATIRQTIPEVVMNPLDDLTLNDITLTGGFDVNSRPGGAIHFDGDLLVINNSSLVGNQTCDTGGGINMDGGSLRLTNSTIANNGAVSAGGAIATHDEPDDGDSIVIVNSTITGNSGGGLFSHDGGSFTLVYTTLVENTTAAPSIESQCDRGDAVGSADDANQQAEAAASPDEVGAQENGFGANVDFDEDTGALTTFGTVIALPGGGPNCADVNDAPLTNTASSGYNFSDDATCGLTNTATGDRESAGDPGLGALANNGGPTQTRLPSSSSPLLNFIPIPACSGGDGLAGFAVTNDQRGILRPQSTGCEVGAVEVVLEVVVDFAG